MRVSVYSISSFPLQFHPAGTFKTSRSMSLQWNRRDILRGFAAIPGAILHQPPVAQNASVGRIVEVQITPLSDHTLRLTLLPIDRGTQHSIADDGSLVQQSWASSATKIPEGAGREISIGSFR